MSTGEGVTEQMLVTSVRQAVLAPSVRDAAALHDRAATAVTDLFCPHVTDLKDVVEGRRSEIHLALIAEVARRVALTASAAAGENGKG